SRPSSFADPEGMQGAITSLAEAHMELRQELERERMKWRSRDKLFICIDYIPKFSFLIEFEDEVVGDLSGNNDEALVRHGRSKSLSHYSESAAMRHILVQRKSLRRILTGIFGPS
ncbi:hypothetical protein HAX54_023184, partial [Datura stramonium]|nr:hypothetical protein [Datura stramonium]